MAGVNKAIIIGHLGADPEVRNMQNGKPVASFSVATSETWRDKTTGERKEHTDWHRVVIFNEALAGVAKQYLHKGSKVYCEGKMQTRKWTDQAGIDRWVTEVVLTGFNCSLTLLDKREGVPAAGDESSYGAGDTRDTTRRVAAGAAPRGDDMDDDIPF